MGYRGLAHSSRKRTENSTRSSRPSPPHPTAALTWAPCSPCYQLSGGWGQIDTGATPSLPPGPRASYIEARPDWRARDTGNPPLFQTPHPPGRRPLTRLYNNWIGSLWEPTAQAGSAAATGHTSCLPDPSSSLTPSSPAPATATLCASRLRLQASATQGSGGCGAGGAGPAYWAGPPRPANWGA